MCIFFEKPLKDFPLYSPILLTHWLRYLQKHIMESFTYLSCQLFFKTSHETLMFQQKLLPLQTKKKLSKQQNGGTLHWYSLKKCLSKMYKLCFSIRKSIGNEFSGNLEPWISKYFPSLSTLGIPHGDSELSKL